MKKILIIISIIVFVSTATLFICDIAFDGVFRKKCDIHGCESKREDSSLYCSLHQCAVAGCSGGSAMGYCSEHRCTVAGCANKKEYGSNGCYKHKCKSPLCNKAKANAIGKYCEIHTCLDVGCRGYKSATDNYCSWHRCKYPNCNDHVSGLRGLCEIHEEYLYD